MLLTKTTIIMFQLNNCRCCIHQNQVEFGNVAVRPSDSGKVFQLYNPEEEVLIFDTVDIDGNQMVVARINEEPLNFLRHGPFDRDLHGHKILLEDDSGV